MSVRDLIDAIAIGDSESIQQTFNQEMAERISTRLDAMRVDVAKNIFREEKEDDKEECEMTAKKAVKKHEKAMH